MIKQKQIATGLATLAVLALLAGCGSHQGDKAKSSATSSSQRVAMSSSSKGRSSGENVATSSSATRPTESSQAKPADYDGVPENAVIKRPNQAIALYAHAMAIPNDPGRFTATQVAGGWRVTDTDSGISSQINFDGSEPDDNGGTIPYSKLSSPDHLGDFQLPAPK